MHVYVYTSLSASCSIVALSSSYIFNNCQFSFYFSQPLPPFICTIATIIVKINQCLEYHSGTGSWIPLRTPLKSFGVYNDMKTSLYSRHIDVGR